MSYPTNEVSYSWDEQAPIPFDQWKNLLTKLTKADHARELSSNPNPHQRSFSRQHSSLTRNSDRQAAPRNQVFGDGMVDSIFISSSANVTHTALDGPRIVSSPTKRYVSSFKTLVTSTANKHSQKISYVNDSVIILKLSKENAPETTERHSQLSHKHRSPSLTSSSTTATPPKQSMPAPPSSHPMPRVEGQKRRLAANEPILIPSTTIELSAPATSLQTMAMSATSQPSSNPSLFAYRNTATSTIRQRTLAETTTNSLLITTERMKSNLSSSMRPARQPLATATTIASAYMPSQPPPPPRNASQNTKSRTQKDGFDYPDPFTNCPQDILSRLAQLTKLQMETVEWEKKRRFTKKKSFTNNTSQGKDSP